MSVEDITNSIKAYLKVRNLDGTYSKLTIPIGSIDGLSEISNRIYSVEDRLDALEYKPIEILTLTNSIGVAEIGSESTSATISWSLSKDATTLSINNESMPSNTKTYTANFNAMISPGSKTWVLIVKDDKNGTSQKSTTAYWYNGIYTGVSEDLTITNSFILSLTKSLSNTRTKNFSVTASGNQYIWYCLPTRLGTPTFNVGGFDGGFSKVNTINFTNVRNYTESYDIWRSDNAGLGSVSIKVS